MTDTPPKDKAMDASLQQFVKRKCPDCDYTPPSRHAWDEHSRVHSGERPFACPSCESAFAKKGDRDTHVRRVHLKADRVTCAWSGCGKSFSSPHHRAAHVAAVHLKKQLTCSVAGCTYTSAWKSRISSHIKKAHSKPSFVSCSVVGCNFQSSFRSTLLAHRRANHDRRQVACTHGGCSFRTSRPKYMKSHVEQVHQKVKRFTCHVCDKGFYLKQKLRSHQQVHAKLGHLVSGCASCQESLEKEFKRPPLISQEEQQSSSSDGVNHLLTTFHVDLQLLSSCE